MQVSKEIEAEVQQLLDEFTSKDMAFFDRISHQSGALGIGTDPREWLVGHGTIAEVFGGQMKNMPPFEFTAHRVAAYQQGDVGWAAVDATWAFPSFPKMQDLSTRVTLVFQREAGAWKIVLFQTAFAFPDEDVFAPMAGG